MGLNFFFYILNLKKSTHEITIAEFSGSDYNKSSQIETIICRQFGTQFHLN